MNNELLHTAYVLKQRSRTGGRSFDPSPVSFDLVVAGCTGGVLDTAIRWRSRDLVEVSLPVSTPKRNCCSVAFLSIILEPLVPGPENLGTLSTRGVGCS